MLPATTNTIILSCSLFLLACGSESKDSDKEGATSGSRENGMTFAAEADLPACSGERDGFLVYVQETSNFRTCSAGAWTVIDIKGGKGEKGDTGASAADSNAAITLYKKYKHSVFQVVLTCDPQVNAPTECGGVTQAGSFSGTAFLCGEKSVCTNNHVVNCPKCYQFKSISLQAVVGSGDSINPNGTNGSAAAPFFTSTSNAMIKLHANKDLARFPITQNPPNAVPLPLSTKLAKDTITPLMAILSMSFPLGFQDLYVDVGNVNTPKIGHCDSTDEEYGCPASFYAFSTTNDTDHGSSGSPLIDIVTGEVVGLTTAGTEGENANFTWATDASYLNGME